MRNLVGLALALSCMACSGQSPTAPGSATSTETAAPISSNTCAVNVAVLELQRREGKMHLTVRNDNVCKIFVGLATYKRIYTDRPANADNLLLYGDSNISLGSGETRSLVTDAVPCGPFRFVAYHSRSTAGNVATKGIPSAFDMTPQFTLREGEAEWNQFAGCVIR